MIKEKEAIEIIEKIIKIMIMIDKIIKITKEVKDKVDLSEDKEIKDKIDQEEFKEKIDKEELKEKIEIEIKLIIKIRNNIKKQIDKMKDIINMWVKIKRETKTVSLKDMKKIIKEDNKKLEVQEAANGAEVKIDHK